LKRLTLPFFAAGGVGSTSAGPAGRLLLPRLKRTLSDKRRMSFNVAMHYPVIIVYYAAISKH